MRADYSLIGTARHRSGLRLDRLSDLIPYALETDWLRQRCAAAKHIAIPSPRRRTRNDRISLEPTITAARWEAQAQLDPEGRSAPGQ